MVLQGFKHAMYLGWFLGVFLLKSPSKNPEPLPRRSPFFVYIVLIIILNLFMRFDFYLTHNQNLRNETMVAKFLDLSLLMGETCFDLFLRGIFLLRSKVLIKFLKTLISDMKKVSSTLILPEKDRKEWNLSAKLVWATLLFHFLTRILVTNWVRTVMYISPPEKNSVLLAFLPKPVYICLFYIFGELPVLSSLVVAFSFVIVCTFHVLWICYDFCDTIQKEISLCNGEDPNEGDLLFIAKNSLGEVDNISVFSVAVSAMQMQRETKLSQRGFTQNEEPLGKDKLIGKLEHLKLACSQYDKICGPLILGLIVRAVYVLISSANSILLYENPENSMERNAKHYLDLFLFPTELVQLWLLPMGAMFKKKINEKKENLSREVIFLEDLETRTNLRNVLTAFSEWDWTLTGGPGFFIVDRSLLSGVVSSLMTYVTILFQLNTPTTNHESDLELISSNNNISDGNP